MIRSFVFGVIASSSSLIYAAPTPPATPASKEADATPLAESIQFLEEHIAQRELRLSEYAKDVTDLNDRVEKRVDYLVKMIAKLDEAKDGDHLKIKQDAVVGLRRYLSLYVDKRREISEKAKAGDQASAADLSKVDDRIHTRLEQINELSGNLPTHEDKLPFEVDSTSYWNGYFYEQSQLLGQAAKPNEPITASDIDQKISKIKEHRKSLKNLLQDPKSTASAKALYTRELGKLDASEEHWHKQIQSLNFNNDQLPLTHSFKDNLSDARIDLREDTSLLFRRYDQFAKNRSYIAHLKRQLESMKKRAQESK